MTNEKALEILNEHSQYYIPPDDLPALYMAFDALKKQIPKKPKVLKIHDISNYKYGECECGEHIMDDHRYCSNCGQALDWSDTE